ncbi:MAG: glycosyltransferase [Promethearchaeota archaeon]
MSEFVTPKVTIGVCVKNSEQTIRDAIESIINQDFSHELMEIIFVDDDSVDNTLSIITAYVNKMDVQSKIFHHDWKGLGFSRNIVIDNAKGKYIIWVDGDMILHEDFVRKQFEFMEKNTKVGIAKAKYGFLKNEKIIAFLDNASYVAANLIYGGRSTERALGTGGSIYRLDAVREAGGFDVNISGVGEDMDVEYKVRKAGWLLFLGSPAVFYEQRRTSLASLWKEGLWHGTGGWDLLFKKGKIFAIYKMSPIAGFLIGIKYAVAAYKITRKKMVFLLPLQYAFKRTAWLFGFLKAQFFRRI